MAIKYSDLSLGQIEALVNKCGGMDGVRRLLSGTAEVVIKKPFTSTHIDLNADPFVPDGWSIEKHQTFDDGNGMLEWGATKVDLYLYKGQQGDKYIEGDQLRGVLIGKPVLNANVLDYLLANPHLIPDNWKKDEKGNVLNVFFWGTIYRDPQGFLTVRCLNLNKRDCGSGWAAGVRWFRRADEPSWGWNAHWLFRSWTSTYPAAMRAS